MALGGAAALLVLYPASTGGLAPHPNPARTYDEALARIDRLQRLDGPEVNEVCRVSALTHGRKVAQAIVLLHGYTNCPRQFRLLGERLHARGHNVLIPRMPYHGLVDRLTPDLARLTASDLVAYVDAAVDAAAGLGERVTVAGLSAGGVLSAWAAQTRGDVDRAVLMSPSFAPGDVPVPRTQRTMNMATRLPNLFVWWDKQRRDRIASELDRYAYPRYSTRAFGEIMRVGLAVMRRAAVEPPAARSILVITNLSDTRISGAHTALLVERWREHGASLETHAFPADRDLIHDFIDPNQPLQRVEHVYPVLIDLLQESGVSSQESGAEPRDAAGEGERLDRNY